MVIGLYAPATSAWAEDRVEGVSSLNAAGVVPGMTAGPTGATPRGGGEVCGPGNGLCCSANNTPGCYDEACCYAVCAIDAFCCDTLWDSSCAREANEICRVCNPPCESDEECDSCEICDLDTSACVPDPAQDCPNDLCEDAFVIHSGHPVTGDTCLDGEFGAVSGGCGTSDTSPDAWYTYTSSCPELGTGEIHAQLCGYLFDVMLNVYTDCSANAGSEIVCNNGGGSCPLNYCSSEVYWNSMDHTTYVIRVSGWANQCGQFQLTLTESCDVPRPPCPNCGTCDGDVNCDGAVDSLDAGAVLARFGMDPCGELCIFDLNCDGVIDPLDTGFVLSRFGTCNLPVDCVQKFCE